MKQQINEIRRMQQLAGLIKEYVQNIHSDDRKSDRIDMLLTRYVGVVLGADKDNADDDCVRQKWQAITDKFEAMDIEKITDGPIKDAIKKANFKACLNTNKATIDNAPSEGVYEADTEEDDDTEEDKPEIRRDAPDASLDVTDPEDLEKKVTAAQIGGEDKGIKSMRSAAEKLAFYKGVKAGLFQSYKDGDIDQATYVDRLTKAKIDGAVVNIQNQIKQLEAKVNKDLTIGDEEEI